VRFNRANPGFCQASGEIGSGVTTQPMAPYPWQTIRNPAEFWIALESARRNAEIGMDGGAPALPAGALLG
jgi:hypothetical protein